MLFKKNEVVDEMLDTGAWKVANPLLCSFDYLPGDDMNKIHKETARERYAQFSAAVASMGYGQDVAFENVLRSTRHYVRSWGTVRFNPNNVPSK